LPTNEDEYSKKSINNTRHVVATAYLGKTGQDKYRLVIKFGRKALSRYSRNLDIKECILVLKTIIGTQLMKRINKSKFNFIN